MVSWLFFVGREDCFFILFLFPPSLPVTNSFRTSAFWLLHNAVENSNYSSVFLTICLMEKYLNFYLEKWPEVKREDKFKSHPFEISTLHLILTRVRLKLLQKLCILGNLLTLPLMFVFILKDWVQKDGIPNTGDCAQKRNLTILVFQ